MCAGRIRHNGAEMVVYCQVSRMSVMIRCDEIFTSMLDVKLMYMSSFSVVVCLCRCFLVSGVVGNVRSCYSAVTAKVAKKLVRMQRFDLLGKQVRLREEI